MKRQLSWVVMLILLAALFVIPVSATELHEAGADIEAVLDSIPDSLKTHSAGPVSKEFSQNEGSFSSGSVPTLKASGDVIDLTVLGICDFEQAWDLMDMYNDYRSSAGFSQATMDYSLTYQAMIRAAELATYYSGDIRPDGREWDTIFTDIDITSGSYGYVVAYGYSTAEDLYDALIDADYFSDDEEFNSVGIGCYYFMDEDVKVWAMLYYSGSGNSSDLPTEAELYNDIPVSILEENVSTYGYVDYYTDGYAYIYNGTASNPMLALINVERDDPPPVIVTSGYTLTTSNSSAITVDGQSITAVSTGSATITAYFGDHTHAISYKVWAKPSLSYSFNSSNKPVISCTNAGEETLKFYKDGDEEWTDTSFVSGSYTHSDAVTGGNYTYVIGYSRLIITDDTVKSEWVNASDQLKVTVPGGSALDAPEVSISNVASSGKIKLKWDAVDGAVEYDVYRATSENGTYKLLKTVTGTSLTNTSTTAGKTYYYYVVAVAEDGTESAASDIVSRTCDCARPEITLSNVASSGKIKIKWDAVDGAESYEVYRATSKSGTYKLLKTVTGTSLTNTSTTAGKTYYYKVRALGSVDAAKSAYSEIKSRTCDCARPEITLSNVASSGKIKIKWDAVDGAESYEVYRATSKSGTYKLLKTVTGTSLTNTSTTAGKTYYYKVRALGSVDAAKSAYSEIKSRTCDLERPDVSITLNNSGKPKLTWDAVDGAVEYEVYRATSKSGTYKLMTTTTKTSYTNTGAEVSKTYYYRVKAIASKSAADSAKSTVDFISCSSVGISNSVLSKKVVTLINEYREDAGLPKLKWYTTGENAAKIRAAELTKSWSVNRPDGSDFSTLCEPYGLHAECLGNGYTSANALVDAMMDNSKMRNICMDEEFTYAVAAYNGKYWAVLFG